MIKSKINDYIDAHKEDMLKDLSRLVAHKSVRSEALPDMPFGKGCAEVLRDALDMCKSYGFITRNIDNYVGTVDLGEYDGEYGILSHLDVVPEGSGWTSDPYTAVVRDDKVFGRGTIDDKGPTIAAIYAMRAVKDMDIPLSKSIRLIMGTDEECGSGDLAYYTKKEDLPKNLFTPDGSFPIINIEKGRCEITVCCDFSSLSSQIVEISGGTVVNAVAECASATLRDIEKDTVMAAIEKINLPICFTVEQNGELLEIKAKGKSAHASTPEFGRNATIGIVTLLSALPLENEYSDALKAIADLFPFGQTDGSAVGLNMQDDKSGALTLVFSLIEADATSLRGTMDIRFPICLSVSEVQNKLEKALENTPIKIVSLAGVEPHYVDENSEFVKTLLGVYEDVTGEKGECLAIGGGTYVHNTEGGVAFGAEFPDKDNHMHGADEYIDIDDLLLTAKVYANAIYELCK